MAAELFTLLLSCRHFNKCLVFNSASELKAVTWFLCRISALKKEKSLYHSHFRELPLTLHALSSLWWKKKISFDLSYFSSAVLSLNFSASFLQSFNTNPPWMTTCECKVVTEVEKRVIVIKMNNHLSPSLCGWKEKRSVCRCRCRSECSIEVELISNELKLNNRSSSANWTVWQKVWY